nr:M23 family metallopeptidase [Chryseobacterium edaphi]
MTAVDQLDYVKKYFEPLRGKSVEFVDFYLQVLFPASSQKEDHIVFASSLDKLTTRTSESDKLRNLRVNAYSQNKGLDNNNDGKVWKSEIKTKVQVYITEGFANKENNFECGQNLQKNTTSEVSKCPEDCSQCLDYADVWENPVISNDNGGKNNNRFGYNSSRGHKGIDILSGPTYKEVHSIMCGEVVSLVNSFKTNEYRSSSLGNTLMIKSKTKDGEIVFILYCHLDKIYVKKGDKIKHGQKVALSGSTGNASYSGLPNGVRGHGIDKANWHCHIEAATKGEGYNNFYSLGSYRVKAEDYMKTKFDKNGNPIK